MDSYEVQVLPCIGDLKFKVKSSHGKEGWPINTGTINIQFRLRQKQRWIGVSDSDHSETLLTETEIPWVSPTPRPFSPVLFCMDLDHDLQYEEKGLVTKLKSMLEELGVPVGQEWIIEETYKIAREALRTPPDHWTVVGYITLETDYLFYGDYVREALVTTRTIPEEEKKAVEEMLVTVTRVTVDGEDEQCPICLEEISQGSEATRMPCSHTFHAHCIARWLNRSHLCPLCRFHFQMPTSTTTTTTTTT